MSKVLVEAREVSKAFEVKGGAMQRIVGHVQAVSDVDLKVFEQESLGLVGESGCGKSTIGRMLLRLIPADSGEILFDGREIGRLKERDLRPVRREMQIIFQDPFSSLDPRTPIGESIAEGLRVHGVHRDERRRRALEALELVGLEQYHYRRFPHEFSGGQRQRIGIARALAVKPRFLVCDEPVSALDVSIRAQVVNLLRDLQRTTPSRPAYLFIGHDLGLVRAIADEVAVLYLGRIVEAGPTAEVFARPRHPYTALLIASEPRGTPPQEGERPARLRAPGEPPSPADPPSGCAFHPRCPSAQAVCRDGAPREESEEGTRRRVSCFFPLGGA